MTTQEDFNPQEAFSKLQQRIHALGIPAKELASLKSYKSLSAPRAPIWPKVAQVCGYVGSFLLVFSVALLVQWPIQRRTLLAVWYKFHNLDIEKEPCIMDLTELVFDVARPPVDCSICENVEEVEVVSKLSQEDFEMKYAYTGRPVVIEDAMVNWTATKTFSFEFFKNIYGTDSPALSNIEYNCQFFAYETDFTTLREVFDMSKERAEMKDEPWYIGWSNCDSSAANILRHHYTRPYFLPAVAESSKTDWIFMGCPGHGARIHIDNVRNPSWQAQVTGEKLWVLEPPPECYHKCKGRIEVTVKPGQIIVIDTNQWFHSTLILGDNMSITIGSEFD